MSLTKIKAAQVLQGAGLTGNDQLEVVAAPNKGLVATVDGVALSGSNLTVDSTIDDDDSFVIFDVNGTPTKVSKSLMVETFAGTGLDAEDGKLLVDATEFIEERTYGEFSISGTQENIFTPNNNEAAALDEPTFDAINFGGTGSSAVIMFRKKLKNAGGDSVEVMAYSVPSPKAAPFSQVFLNGVLQVGYNSASVGYSITSNTADVTLAGDDGLALSTLTQGKFDYIRILDTFDTEGYFAMFRAQDISSDDVIQVAEAN